MDLSDGVPSMERDNSFTTDISGYKPRISMSCVAKIITDTTSGTTGREKRVYYTERDMERTVEIFVKGIAELKSRRTLIAFPDSGEYSLGGLIGEAVRRLGSTPVFFVPHMSYREMVRLAAREHPDAFIGFPQTLLALQRLTGGCFDAGLISGDYCIKADYMCPVFPHYGSREMGLAGAISCSARQGMHMRPDVKAEIIDENGLPVPDGTEGELVISTPEMEAMPLSRYRTGDYTYIIPNPCSCGSDWVRLGNVRRRTAAETLDDEAFRDPELIDRRGDRIITLKNIRENDAPLYSGKRV